MCPPHARDTAPPSEPADRAARSKATSDDWASDASEDESPRVSLAPLAHHALATAVYCLVGYALWLANATREAGSEAPELTDAEKRALHYQNHPIDWVETRLPTTAVGWLSLGVGAWMAWNWSARVYRVKKILDVRHAARAGALNRAVLANADTKRVRERRTEMSSAASRRREAQSLPGDALNPCSDPKCLRCRPSAHEAALARHALRLRDLAKDDPAFAKNVRADVLALASASRAKTERGTRRNARASQAPTVFRLPELCAVPIHNRYGLGCVDASGKSRQAARFRRSRDADPRHARFRRRFGGVLNAFGATRSTRSATKCACASIWGDAASDASDVAILEAAAPAIRREVLEAAFAPRSRKASAGNVETNANDAVFMPFDPAVRKGGDWSAVYLYRNGVKDRRACEAFPAATEAIERLRNGCFGSGDDAPGASSGCAFGSAFISKLEPDTLITPHCGPCNARLRCSLGLDAPRRVAKKPETSGFARFVSRIGLAAPKKNVAPDASRRDAYVTREGAFDDDDHAKPPTVRGRRTVTRRVLEAIARALRLAARVALFPAAAARRVAAIAARASLRVARPLFRVARAAAAGEGLPFVLLGASSEAASAFAPKCELRVADATAEWEDARCVLFDDSFVHSAEFRRGASAREEAEFGWARGALAKPRLVLVVDLWHPELSAADRLAIRTLYPPGMGAAAEAHAEETEGRKTKLAEYG